MRTLGGTPKESHLGGSGGLVTGSFLDYVDIITTIRVPFRVRTYNSAKLLLTIDKSPHPPSKPGRP